LSFLAEYPNTPYREEIERHIFEISTAAGSKTAYDQFLLKHPHNAYVQRASDILYHILLETDTHQELPPYLQSDSIMQVDLSHKGYLVPFFKGGKYGFMDMAGNELKNAEAHEISTEYLCGNITEDVIVVGDKILSRNGKVIFQGKVDDLDDLGYGFLKINSNKIMYVLHKTGFAIPEQAAEDAKLLAGKFLALKKDNRWSVWTLTGRKVIDYAWEDANHIGDVIILQRKGKLKLATVNEVAQLADQYTLKVQDLFDEIKLVKRDFIWAKTGDFEGVLDQNLTSIVPFEKHALKAFDFGVVATTAYGKKIFNLKGGVSAIFENVKSNEQWTAVKQAGTWRLFGTSNYGYQSTAYDSIGFIGPFAVGQEADSIMVYLSDVHHYPFIKTKLEFIPGGDSISYLMVDEGDKKSLYSTEGLKVFTVSYDKISYAGDNIFIVHKKEKKGLISADGKIILPVEYDAIGGVKDKSVSVLKNMKFGLFQIAQRKLIKPQYDKNLIMYNDNLLTGFKDGFYGFIGWDGKPLTKFEFDEIVFWNDTVALVKKNAQWMLQEIKTQKVILGGIRDYKWVSDLDLEKLAIIHKENGYGVLSSKNGTIIPINFTDVKNVGSSEEPMYFTEKHVEEASVYIVMYYNKHGILLRRQVYEEDDYEEIYCSDN
jgi:sporulation protein YlmC with PRC-barrel domain